MAIDYSKPGKTAPGTKHARPERKEKRTWLDVVAPAPGYVLPEQFKPPTTVQFTRPTTPANLGTTRRERRDAARAAGEDPSAVFETREESLGELVNGRAGRRWVAARRERQQRKGQKAFNRQQIAQERERDTITALVAVAEGKTTASPVVVENATFGLQRKMEAAQRAN